MASPIHVPTLEEEVQPYRDLTDAQRAVMLRAVCRAGVRMARARPDSAAVFAYQDPLSSETEALLQRLHERYRQR